MNKEKMIENILGSADVQEMLLINRQRLNALVDKKKLTPLKKLKRESLFWKPEVLELKEKMESDTRTNLYKKKAE
jgi:hypothetical protein